LKNAPPISNRSAAFDNFSFIVPAMSGPLSSLKILEFSTLLPGPFASMMLADLGADVVRIEAPHRPDLIRSTPPFDGDTSAWHAVLNRSKRSIALDLKQPGAVEVVKRLVETYDIVLEQFRPGVMDRLGIGYETLRMVNPRLIYCAITGYGQTGPYRDRAGHDINYLSLAGLMSHTGRKEAGPLPLGVQVADVGGGSYGAVVGLLSAVIAREQTGMGQFVDISMFDGSIAWNALAASQYLVGGENPQPESGLLNGGSYYDFYRTRDGRYLSVGSLEPKFWQGFCRALERPDLIEQGYEQNLQVQQALKMEIQTVIATRSLEAWLDIFAGIDVCVEPVLSVEEMIAHPQTQARQMIVSVPKPDGGQQQQVASPYKFSQSKLSYQHVGCAVGAHTEDVLTEIGYQPEAIEALRAAGVFGGQI
jgi:crotonobetainyl-CoA:carnitine CoA-transferase CaiB-like acyl-CoA transferase